MLRGIPHFIAYKGCLPAMQDPFPQTVNEPMVEAVGVGGKSYSNQWLSHCALGKSHVFTTNCSEDFGDS